MPLAFQSSSHGQVAFGFFHIESDMLLLERLFFFAGDFCKAVSDLAQRTEETFSFHLPGWRFKNPADAGDLMGAIHGICFSGFIGSLYRRHPFPRRPEAFKQKVQGRFSRQEVAALIERWASRCRILFQVFSVEGPVCIDAYRFEKQVFWELIDYVWRGGYPRWESDRRPSYVLEMKAAVERGKHPLLSGMPFS